MRFAHQSSRHRRRTVDKFGAAFSRVAKFLGGQRVDAAAAAVSRLDDGYFPAGAREFVGVFKFGSMPYAHAERSLRLFSEQVLPDLHAMAVPSPVLPDTAGV